MESLETPKALMVVDLRELALIYELSQEAAQDESLHTSDRRTAADLHEMCCDLLGRNNSSGSSAQ